MSTRRRNIRTQTEEELAELEAAERGEQGTSTTIGDQRQAGPVNTQTLTPPPPTQEDEEPEESRTHLVKHRAPRAENEEEQFDSVYKRDTYYIDRTYPKRLKKMIKKTQRTKTALMNEGLELLFEKYGIE
jgi:hypothetical protein